MRALIALAFVLVVTPPAWAQRPADPRPDPHRLLRTLEDAFAAVADRVTPAVVNVSTVPRRTSGANPPEDVERFREFFGDDFYERYFKRRREDVRATGSGVMVDPKGYILTNNHVIENAQEIIVRLSDSRKFTARLIGRDAKTDL